jgi:hypothetical protein
MMQNGQQTFSHVLWIGGATDSGKSTVAQKLAERHRLGIYHYDRSDLTHHEQLGKNDPVYRSFLTASLDERWVFPDPEELFQRMLRSARDRFPLVLQDLIAMPRERGIVAEGFGFFPELLAPLLSHPRQALWLVPTEAFKRESMIRRGKPSFGAQVSDLERAKTNLAIRDKLLKEYIQAQALKFGCRLYEVDGTRSADEMVDLIERQFAPYFES